MIRKSQVIKSIPGKVETRNEKVMFYSYYNETKGRGMNTSGLNAFRQCLLIREGFELTDGEILLLNLKAIESNYKLTRWNKEGDELTFSAREREIERIVERIDKPEKSLIEGLDIETLMSNK